MIADGLRARELLSLVVPEASLGLRSGLAPDGFRSACPPKLAEVSRRHCVARHRENVI